ncbi:ATP-binding protein, partial [Streptomyces yanii]
MKPSRPLYEREPELAAAAQAVDALCGAQAAGGLLIFSGEAGIGKTALLTEIRTMAVDRCTIWSARGGETVTSVPFHVVRQLLQPALDQFPPDEVRGLFGAWFEVAAPALGLAEPSGPQPDPQGVRDGLDHVVSRLASRLSHRPLLLIIDDAHWADGESLAWLASFTARLGELPVLVVQAHRPEELAARTGDGGSHPAQVRVALRALTPDATAELVRATLGDHADAPFCREVWAVTGGNPYEAVELVAKVQDRELVPLEESAGLLRELGASARGSGLVDRLERLGTNANRFAWAAAVLGTDISQDLAATLAGMSPAEAADCTARLRDARIVSGFDPLEFVHPLIATAVYRSIPPATRTAMHGRAAWAITRAGLGA